MSMIGCFLQITQDQLNDLITIDVDKAWHGIHYLLSSSVWEGEGPLADVVLRGTEIGGDVGYGPARYLTPQQVQAVAEALADLPTDYLERRYNREELARAEIYPEIWDEGEGALEYLQHWYESLRKYYLDAASKRNAMLKFIN
jgi:hypothetical protein